MNSLDDRIHARLRSLSHSQRAQQIADALRIDTAAVWGSLDRLAAAGRVIQHAPGWYRAADETMGEGML